MASANTWCRGFFFEKNDEFIFPATTLLINAIGALAIGIVVAYFTQIHMEESPILLFLKVGICGGFTTFSSFSLESMQLFEKGEIFLGVLYISASVILCLAAVFAGQHLVDTFFSQS